MPLLTGPARARHLLLVAACAAWAALAASAHAVGGTLTDQAVHLTYGASHWDGTPDADFVGTEPTATTDIVYQTGWWYRVNGLDTREFPLPAPSSESYSGGGGEIAWTNVDGKGFDLTERVGVFDVELPSGAFTSRLNVTNNTGAPLSLSLFHYLDADANGDNLNDTGGWINLRILDFNDGPTVGLYRADGVPSHFQIGAYPTLRDLLNDGTATTLTNSGYPFGPGDWTAAYQWDSTLPVGTTYDAAGVTVSSRLQGWYTKGDLIVNGNADILFWKPSTGETRVWDMRRESAYGLWYLPTDLRRPVGVDDFVGGWDNDLVLEDLATGQVTFRDFTSGDFPLTGAGPLPLNWKLSATADFNHDAFTDLVWRNTTSQKIVIWKMGEGTAPGTQKTGNIIPSPDQAVDGNWEIVGARDFNYDGNNDFLWYNSTSGKVVLWYMDASVVRISGGFTTPANAGDNNWKVVATADFGQGVGGIVGTPDILWRNQTSNRLVVWHMGLGGARTSGLFTTPDSYADLSWEVVGPR